MTAVRIGIDLGGTKIEGVALDDAGALIARERIATEREGGYAHILGRIATLHASIVRRAGAGAHTLGIGTPGSISPRTGLLRNSNTVALNGRPLVADLEQRLGRTFAIENDANCFALAEALHGAGRGHALVFGVILGTGCGGGIVWNGRVHAGRNRLGGEWGHTVLDPAGPACFCGAHGCVETFLCGPALEAEYARRSGLRRGAAAIAAATSDDAAARATLDAYIERFGRALANLVDVLDPDMIVLGGGLSNVDALYSRGVEAVSRHVFGDAFDTPIVRHALGDSAGVIGAALLGGAPL
jgi:fructokinase